MAMSQLPQNRTLPFPDLRIEGFRGIDSLTLPRLGRVTLFSGRNGVGKTTVLESARIVAARGRAGVLERILARHDEFAGSGRSDGDSRGSDSLAYKRVMDVPSLFYGRKISPDHPINIGSSSGPNRLSIKVIGSDVIQQSLLFPVFDHDMTLFKVEYGFESQFNEQFLPWYFLNGRIGLLSAISGRDIAGIVRNEWDAESIPAITCETLGPEILNNRDVVRLWNEIALTDDENNVVETLSLTVDSPIQRIGVIEKEEAGRNRSVRYAIVRLDNRKEPVPLRSLGDGAVRLFGFALALARCKNGVLLIDEVENGLHHYCPT